MIELKLSYDQWKESQRSGKCNVQVEKAIPQIEVPWLHPVQAGAMFAEHIIRHDVEWSKDKLSVIVAIDRDERALFK